MLRYPAPGEGPGRVGGQPGRIGRLKPVADLLQTGATQPAGLHGSWEMSAACLLAYLFGTHQLVGRAACSAVASPRSAPMNAASVSVSTEHVAIMKKAKKASSSRLPSGPSRGAPFPIAVQGHQVADAQHVGDDVAVVVEYAAQAA